MIQRRRGEKINPVFIPAKGQYKQSQTTKLKVMVAEENAQSIGADGVKNETHYKNKHGGHELKTLLYSARIFNSTTAAVI